MSVWLIMLVAALAIIVVIALILRSGAESGGPAGPTQPATTPGSSAPSPTVEPGEFVDASVTEQGWLPEPITTDRDAYAEAALRAAATFDTQLATREQWVTWLGSWFTPSPLYSDPTDAADQMAGYLAELDQSVLLPQSKWDDLADEDGRVEAELASPITYLDLPETAAAKVWTGSADVKVTYFHSSGGEESSYSDTVRVSVQVVCGDASVPTPASGQQPGDCKVVRFFDTAVG
jgi:hypothetical protein